MLTAVNDTIAGNSVAGGSGSGGGLDFISGGGTATLDNTIVAQNTDATGADDIDGTVTGSYNLVGTGGSGGLTDSNGNQLGVANPGLGVLGNNGGPTETIALLANSPAGGAGEPELAVDPTTGQLLLYDQRGPNFLRIVNGAVDIGAFEVQAPLTSVYVSSAYANDAPGTLVTWTDGSTHVVGYDAFGTIPSGLDAVSFGGTVNIGAGTYAGTVELSANVTLAGAGASEVTMDGGGQGPVVTVDSGVTATIAGLTVTDGYGFVGGIFSSGMLTVSGCAIAANTGTVGGGGIASSPLTDTPLMLTIINSTISDNSGIEDATAAGIYMFETTLTLLDSSVSDNVCDNAGGGIDAEESGMTITGSTIDYNSSGAQGGGIESIESGLTIINSTVASNSVAGQGGGIYYNSGPSNPLTADNDTIAYNQCIGTSGAGAGIYATDAGLYNTIVALNTDSNDGGEAADDIAGTAAGSYNLIGTGGSGGLTNSNGNQVGVASADVGLAAGPANNGGPIETIALLAGSPAIDEGSATISIPGGLTVPTIDQRGAVRGGQADSLNAGDTVDIGAYEASSSYLVTTTADSTDIGTLRSAILWADASSNANPINLKYPATNTIDFDFPTTDPGYAASTTSWTIAPTSPLPPLSTSITIDGYTQPGYATILPVIVLSGASAGQGSDGLDLTGGGISVWALTINGFSGDGINVESSDNTIQDCVIGTDATAQHAVGNGIGIAVTGASNLIGTNGRGTTLNSVDNGDLIAGNEGTGVLITGPGATGNVVANVDVGWDFVAVIPNGGDGVLIDDGASDNWIGVNPVYGPGDAGDYIGYNTAAGVEISGAGTTGNVVAGDYIGARPTGTQSLPNYAGVEIDGGAFGNLIGASGQDGTDDALERNIISGNLFAGVWITGAGTDQNVVAGNDIGTDGTGTRAVGNGSTYVGVGDDNIDGGVLIDGGASDNLIGTSGQSADDAGERNVISGNDWTAVILSGTGTSNNVVAGNYLGTTASGRASLANGTYGNGVDIVNGASGNWVGVNSSAGPGTENADQGNLISGNNPNNGWGVWIDPTSSGNVIAGNLIGTTLTGEVSLPDAVGVYIQGPSNLVGTNGDGVDDAIERNVISGNTFFGVVVNGTAAIGNIVAGNYIGTNAAGKAAVANAYGVVIQAGASGNTIGGIAGSSGNLISGNASDGVVIALSGTTNNVVAANYIGTTAGGNAALANGTGVVIEGDASDNTIGGTSAGAGNVIAYNHAYGITVGQSATDSTADNEILSESIYGNDGGIDNVASGLLTITDSTISGNTAPYGGGIDNSGSLTATDSTITGNQASNNGGGIDNSGTLTLTASTIAGNGAVNIGGGIGNTGTLIVTDSTITNNGGGNNGGGIDNSGMLTVTDSTITSNGALNGGGIDNFGTLTVVNTTIAYNSLAGLSGGGGLNDETGSTTVLDNTIVALNTNVYSGPEDIAGGPVSSASAYNLIGTGGSGGLTNGINGNLVGVADPGLTTELANNGGPTQTIALLPGSPAIDHGSNALANEYSLTTDQRGAGFPRIVNGNVDIGAFESPVFGNPTVYTVNLTSDTGAFNGTNAATAASGDVLWAITQANANTNPAGSLIEFDIPTTDPGYNAAAGSWTITLTSTLDLSEPIWPEVIQGPGADVLTISGNNAVRVFGVGSTTTATVSGLTISGGSNANGASGIDNFGSLTVTGCAIADNRAGNNCGGIQNEGTGILTVTDCTISGNSANNIAGGIENFNVATITDSTIEDNSATTWSGGIDSYGFLVVTNCTIADNTAGILGSGVFNEGGAMILTNSTITENAGGPGVEAAFSASSMRVTDCTVADNPGGGILVSAGALTIENSIVALNGDSTGGIFGVSFNFGVGPSTPLVAYNNLVDVDEFGTLTNGVNGNIVGVDPHLGPLANNGGPTETIALLPGSPAIVAGSVALAVDASGQPLTTDQRGPGYPRIVNGFVDIGAFELPPASSVYVSSAYAGDGPATAVTWTDGSTHVVGYDAFGTIQSAVNAVAAGGSVNIAAGTYSEQVTISQGLSLTGAGSATTILQPPAGVNSGEELEIASGVSVFLSGITVDPSSLAMTAIDVNGGSLIATGIAVISYNTGLSVENGGVLTITDSTISGATTGIVIGSGATDTSSLTATNDSFAGDTVGVQNNQSSGTLTTTTDWWGSSTGPTNSSNPGGAGAELIGDVNLSPWLGDANIVTPDDLVFLTTTGNSFVVAPNGSDTSLGVSLGGSPVGSITGSGTLSFAGTGATVTIYGESGSGSTDDFIIMNTAVQFSAADGLNGSTINFRGTGMTRNVDAEGTTNTFNIQSTGTSGPSGSLVGDSGANAFIFSAAGKLLGGIQGGGSSTLNYAAYSSGVTVNLGNGTNGTATGVVSPGTVSGITAIIGSSHNDTLNAGSVPGVALTGGVGTNTLSGTGTGDSVVESLASSYTLTNAKLTGTSPTFTDNLSGIAVAELTGASPASNTFTVSGWTGTGSLSAPAGTGTVTDSASGSFTLTNSQLTAGNTTLGLSGIAAANLTDTSSGGNTFAVAGWTGSGTLKGSAETLVGSISSSVVLAKTSLAVTGGPTLTLSGFTTANLTDSAGGNTFTVSGWTGSGSLTDNAATGDTVTASKSAGYTLTNTSLSSTDGMALGLSGITTANLATTSASKTFTVSGWTGSGSLTDTATGIITASENGGFILTNTSLSSTNGMSLGLSGITTANVTDTSSGGNTFTVGGWTGKGSLTGTADTLADTVAASATLTNTSLAVTGLPTLSLSGLTAANLTDTSGGNTFTVGGWTGSGSLTDSAATGDTVTVSTSAGFTLANTSLSSIDGM